MLIVDRTEVFVGKFITVRRTVSQSLENSRDHEMAECRLFQRQSPEGDVVVDESTAMGLNDLLIHPDVLHPFPIAGVERVIQLDEKTFLIALNLNLLMRSL